MYSPDRIKRSSLDEGCGGCVGERWVSGAAADRVVRRRLATFEYFASLDNHRTQKDSSTADTHIYILPIHIIYTLCKM